MARVSTVLVEISLKDKKRRINRNIGGFICKAKNKICKGKYRIQIDYRMNCDE
jgi:hypothetical protein